MLWDSAAEAKITGFLETLRVAGLRFEYTFRRAVASMQPQHGTAESSLPLTLAASPGADTSVPAAAVTEPAPSEPSTVPQLEVSFTGPDAPLMIERGGELLHAMESLAAGILRLEPEQNDLLSFDALGFKQERQAATERTAQQGIDAVHATGQPFVFPPMNSRERRMLHLVLAASGLPTASSGEGPRRVVVVYPPGMTPTPEQFNPQPPTRRLGYSNGPRAFGGRVTSNPSSFRGSGSSSVRQQLGSSSAARQQPRQPPPPAAPRLDPNGNPLEQPSLPEVAAAASEQERLASLRRAFRKR